MFTKPCLCIWHSQYSSVCGWVVALVVVGTDPRHISVSKLTHDDMAHHQLAWFQQNNGIFGVLGDDIRAVFSVRAFINFFPVLWKANIKNKQNVCVVPQKWCLFSAAWERVECGPLKQHILTRDTCFMPFRCWGHLSAAIIKNKNSPRASLPCCCCIRNRNIGRWWVAREKVYSALYMAISLHQNVITCFPRAHIISAIDEEKHMIFLHERAPSDDSQRCLMSCNSAAFCSHELIIRSKRPEIEREREEENTKNSRVCVCAES